MKKLVLVGILVLGLVGCEKKFNTYEDKINYCIDNLDSDICTKEDYVLMNIRMSVDVGHDVCRDEALKQTKMCLFLSNKDRALSTFAPIIGDAVQKIKHGNGTERDRYIYKVFMEAALMGDK